MRDGLPPLGAFVNVKWTDGVIYDGHFQGSRSVDLFTVSFLYHFIEKKLFFL